MEELEVLKRLVRGFSCNFRDLAREMKIPYTTLIDKVKRMVKNKIIINFIPKINFNQLNLKILVIIFKDLDLEDYLKLKEELKEEKDIYLSASSNKECVIIYLGKNPEKFLRKIYKKFKNKVFYYSIFQEFLNQNLFIDL